MSRPCREDDGGQDDEGGGDGDREDAGGEEPGAVQCQRLAVQNVGSKRTPPAFPWKFPVLLGQEGSGPQPWGVLWGLHSFAAQRLINRAAERFKWQQGPGKRPSLSLIS